MHSLSIFLSFMNFLNRPGTTETSIFLLHFSLRPLEFLDSLRGPSVFRFFVLEICISTFPVLRRSLTYSNHRLRRGLGGLLSSRTVGLKPKHSGTRALCQFRRSLRLDVWDSPFFTHSEIRESNTINEHVVSFRLCKCI